MALTRAKKLRIFGALCNYFLKKGKVLSAVEYGKQGDKPFGLSVPLIKKAFANWGSMQRAVEAKHPQLVPSPVAKPIVKPTPKVKPTPTPVAKKKKPAPKAKPAVFKPAVKTGKK